MPAYYSEFDPKAAAWLRELIKRGLIADGVVDERDLWDVAPADLRDFAQVHLCAGIGVWSYALRSAGWPDDRPVWTGSFPCQPFSAAGKGAGFADERHLWPAGFHLIEQCRPDVIFGEQVSSKDGLMWFDLVSADLEGSGYAVGAADTCSAGVGAPHIRQRLYWVADASDSRREHVEHTGPAGLLGGETSSGEQVQQSGADCSGTGGLAYADRGQRDGLAELRGPECDGQDAGRPEGGGEFGPRRYDGGLADADDARPQGRIERGDGPEQRPAGPGGVAGGLAHAADGGREPRTGDTRVRAADDGAGAAAEQLRSPRSSDRHGTPGPTNGLWQDADWLFCRDGKWRPVEPGTFPLAHGSPARVGRLRGYGNAINAEAAKVFIEAYLDTRAIEAGA